MANTFLDKFLVESRERIKNPKATICTGTEACDPDSFVSMLTLSLAENAIPVVNMSRSVFECKKEMTYICKLLDLNLDNLIFIENPYGETPYEKLEKKFFVTSNEIYRISDLLLELILVDHHIPADCLKGFPIRLIIDHHKVIEKIEYERIIVNTLAVSCCTLVFQQSFYKLKENGNLANLFRVVALVICYDSDNFKNSHNILDIEVYDTIAKTYSLDRNELTSMYSEIKRLSSDESGMPNSMILLKDFKKFNSSNFTYGSSTIKLPYFFWIGREKTKLKKSVEFSLISETAVFLLEKAILMTELLKIIDKDINGNCLTADNTENNNQFKFRLNQTLKSNNKQIIKRDNTKNQSYFYDSASRIEITGLNKKLEELKLTVPKVMNYYEVINTLGYDSVSSIEIEDLNKKLEELKLTVPEVMDYYEVINSLGNQALDRILKDHASFVEKLIHDFIKQNSEEVKDNTLEDVISILQQSNSHLSIIKSLNIQIQNIVNTVSFGKIFYSLLLNFNQEMALDFLVLNFAPSVEDNRRYISFIGNTDIINEFKIVFKSAIEYEGFTLLEVSPDLTRKKLVPIINSIIEKIY